MQDKDKNNEDSKAGGNFGLPGNYFERSAQSIFSKVEWEEEHKAYPELLKLHGKHGFDVPENYFGILEIGLELLEYPNLKAPAKESGFSIPAGYFEANEFDASEKLKITEEEELFSFKGLKTISRQNNFHVPQEYFNSSAVHIRSLLTETESQEIRVISVIRRNMAYSVAAILLVVISLWIYNYYFKPAEVKDCGTIACLDRTDLLKTKNLETLDNDELYELVNPAELEKNLDSETDKKTPALREDSGLRDIPTEELLDEI